MRWQFNKRQKKFSFDRRYGHMHPSPVPAYHFFFLWDISIATRNFLDNTYFLETPSAIPMVVHVTSGEQPATM